MNSYAEFVPKKTEVPVGDVVLECRELSAAQSDAIVVMVGEKIQAVNVRTMLRQARGVEAGQAEEAGTRVIDVVQEVFSGMLTDAVCVVLDTNTNRELLAKSVFGGKEVPGLDELPLHEKFGCEFWKPLWSWVRANVTNDQRLNIVREVIRLNDFRALGKNLMTLVNDLVPGLGEGQQETTTQAR